MQYRFLKDYEKVETNYLLAAIIQAETASEDKEDKMIIVDTSHCDALADKIILVTDHQAIKSYSRDYKIWCSFNTLICENHYTSLFRGILTISELHKINKFINKINKKKLEEVEYRSRLNKFYFKLKYHADCGIIKPVRRRSKHDKV